MYRTMERAEYEIKAQEGIERFYRTKADWRRIAKQYGIDGRDYIVLLASKDEEINYYTLRFLSAFQQKNRGRKYYILSSSAQMEEFVRIHTSVPYQFVPCTQTMADSFAWLYGICSLPSQLIVNSFELSTDTDAFQLAGGQITKADVVALVVLHLDEVPDVWNGELRGIDSKSEPGDSIQYEVPYAPEDEDDTEKIVAHALNPLLKSGNITKRDKLVLFGVTQTARCAAEILEGCHVSAFWDNSDKLVGTTVDGIPVESPRTQSQAGDVKILIASRHYKEICGQLQALGYEIGKQVFVIFSIRQINPTTKVLRHLVEDRILEGKRVYEEIRAGYPEETIFVRPWQGTGDIYLLGAYIEEMLKNAQTDRYVLTVPTMSIKKTIELFGVRAIICNSEDAFKMLQFGRLMGFEELGMVSLNDNLDQRDLVRMRGYKGLDSHTLFQKLVFRCKERATDFHFYQENSDELFDHYHLQKGRTVLLSPYAVTIDNLPGECWERIAEKLIQKGMTVCTNVGSDREMPVQGTQGIFIPYKQIVDFTEKAGGFIGLRNGLCDIISSSHARLAAIYPEQKPHGNSFYYRCYSLEKMGLRHDNLLELEYDEELTDMQIDEIVRFIVPDDIDVSQTV